MANVATVADLLAGCATRVTPDACNKVFAATTPPKGNASTDTLMAAESHGSQSAPRAPPGGSFGVYGPPFPRSLTGLLLSTFA
jgi:hypothetical protein